MQASTIDNPDFAAETDNLLNRLAAGYEPPDEPDQTVNIADVYLPLRGGPVPIRVYRPPGHHPRPLVLWLHVGGSVADLDFPCSHIAPRAGVTLVSLEYRLAPAHPFPAALHDTCETIGWLRQHGDLIGGDGRLAAGGQSAGGNLVAAVCLKRDTGEPSTSTGATRRGL